VLRRDIALQINRASDFGWQVRRSITSEESRPNH